MYFESYKSVRLLFLLRFLQHCLVKACDLYGLAALLETYLAWLNWRLLALQVALWFLLHDYDFRAKLIHLRVYDRLDALTTGKTISPCGVDLTSNVFKFLIGTVALLRLRFLLLR